MMDKHGANQSAGQGGQQEKASSRARKTRLEEALRENLKRRKLQARAMRKTRAKKQPTSK